MVPDWCPNSSPVGARECHKRFSHQWVNELWQMDIMYGPHLKVGRTKKQTNLIAFIDDASRLVTAAQFCWEQNFTAVRTVLKEAIFIPAIISSDCLKSPGTDFHIDRQFVLE